MLYKHPVATTFVLVLYGIAYFIGGVHVTRWLWAKTAPLRYPWVRLAFATLSASFFFAQAFTFKGLYPATLVMLEASDSTNERPMAVIWFLGTWAVLYAASLAISWLRPKLQRKRE